MSLPRRALFGLGALVLAGCAPSGHPASAPAISAAAPAAVPSTTTAARPAPPELPRQLPGVGPRMLAAVPAEARQVLVVTGDGPEATTGHAVLYRDDGAGWLARPSSPTRNGGHGWSADHREGDLRSPVGVFGLSDAGGRLPNPGTRLPYDRTDTFTIGGTGLMGEPLAGSFDYVVAIDYNRVPGNSPLDTRRPRGGRFGGGIWLHADHGGPTHGCVALPLERMRDLLLALDPALHPVVVMGDAQSLAG
ncbi:L,D-transpeptidase family protein [Kitasatospora sp. NPDC051170]|uniref:L,D-transpeptidase family protein n=1 Tax=Kitasatospora sp. NPDC051170 TaxID=3364056 RepID=UPI0037BC5F92